MMIDQPTIHLNIAQLNRPIELFVHDDRDQHVSKDLAENGIWEVYETQLLLERLSPGLVFIDVGANIGYYTTIAADQIGASGFIAAFEPEPDNYRLLEKNIHRNGFEFVQAIHAGLSDQHGEGQLFLNTTNFGDHQVYDNGNGRQSCAIQLLNGTQYLQDKVDGIDLLKIDTQGAESQVIKGLLPLLQASGQRLTMIIEFWPFGLRKAGSSGHQLLDMLATLNLPFKIIDHIDHQLIDCTEQQLREWVDMLDDHPDDEGFMNIMLGK